jgi:quercetin dioxygenase-like cupin family protein
MTPGSVRLVPLGDAEIITDQERREVRILVAGPDLTVTWSRYAARERGPDLHVHREHTDAFSVLDGELTFAVGPRADRQRVPAGGFVAVPPGVVHTFANESTAEARWLNLHAPDTGFAAYLRAARDGVPGASFDSFDPPADGGRPAAGAIVTLAGRCAVPDLAVAQRVLDDGSEAPRGRQEDGVRAYYVLEGAVAVTIEDWVRVAGPDTLVAIPPGVGHAATSADAAPARVLTIHVPARTRC